MLARNKNISKKKNILKKVKRMFESKAKQNRNYLWLFGCCRNKVRVSCNFFNFIKTLKNMKRKKKKIDRNKD